MASNKLNLMPDDGTANTGNIPSRVVLAEKAGAQTTFKGVIAEFMKDKTIDATKKRNLILQIQKQNPSLLDTPILLTPPAEDQ